jgi:hypothetical protein
LRRQYGFIFFELFIVELKLLLEQQFFVQLVVIEFIVFQLIWQCDAGDGN